MKSCCDEYCANNGCNQGRNCPARITQEEMGEPYPLLDTLIYVVAIVFMLSGLGYLLGGWR